MFEGCIQTSGAECAQPERCPTREQVYAMAYVKPQTYEKILSDEDALSCGTLFPSLYLPFEGGRR